MYKRVLYIFISYRLIFAALFFWRLNFSQCDRKREALADALPFRTPLVPVEGICEGIKNRCTCPKMVIRILASGATTSNAYTEPLSAHQATLGRFLNSL